MRRAAFIWILIGLLVNISVVGAQTSANQTTNYSIRNIRSSFSSDGQEAIIQFEVYNTGRAADRSATVEMAIITTGQVVANAQVAPLREQEITTVMLRFPLALFEPGSLQSMRVAVGINEVEQERSDNIGDNYARISIAVPPRAEGGSPDQPNTQNQQPPNADNGAPVESVPIDPVSLIEQVNTLVASPQTLIVVAGVFITLLIFIVWVLFRLLFARPSAPNTWQPPYANMPLFDPNTVIGRRQRWQQHAQDGPLPATCTESSVYVRKMLVGVDGRELSGWRVMGIQIGQYDLYGRVARSQVTARKRTVRSLDRIVRKGWNTQPDRLQRQVRPVARSLVSGVKSKINDRNAMLPIACDIRMQGTHGEVRIIFELYQCQYGQWQKLDQWEPEMTVIGKTIYESRTYAFHGQRSGETSRIFRKRLQDDLTAGLVAMVKPEIQGVPPDMPTDPVPVTTNTPPVLPPSI